MKVDLFAMERWQSTYENQVEFNLSESGVHPMKLGDLVEDPSAVDALLGCELGYTQSNGTPALRALVASMYPGSTVDHVEITNGGSEANFVVTWNLLEPQDEVVLMVPNYMQTWGLAKAFAGTVRLWPLVPSFGDGSWHIDIAALESLVNPRTKLIIICNPNNPTGARLSESDLDAICRMASRHGAWVLSDEIYRGAELDGRITPSMWGRYERVIITSGLSKAYGLPGLRIGWIVAPPPTIASLWSYHDYTTIAPGAINDRLAQIALAPAKRHQILERTRSILRTNWPLVTRWLSTHGDHIGYIAPEAGAIVYLRYHYAINSTELVGRLRETKSVLIVAGDHFGMDGYLRIGFGSEPRHLFEGLERVNEVLATLA